MSMTTYITFADYLERRRVADADVRNFLGCSDVEALRRRSWADLIRAIRATGADEGYIAEARQLHQEYARAAGKLFDQQVARDESPKPPESDVGARIRIKAEYAGRASDLFISKGVTPIYAEHRADASVSYWFGKLSDADLFQAANAVPQEWYALSAHVR
jgi:hypothetical protein